MRTSFGGIRKYKFVIGKIIMALFLAVLISGISTAWAEPKEGRGYKKNIHKRYEQRRPYYAPHYEPRRVYVPPPVYYAPPPPPWGVEIFLPPIIIR
jgi:hypothetical protein